MLLYGDNILSSLSSDSHAIKFKITCHCQQFMYFERQLNAMKITRWTRGFASYFDRAVGNLQIAVRMSMARERCANYVPHTLFEHYNYK